MILTIKRLFPVLCALLLIGAGACSEEHQTPPPIDSGEEDGEEKPVEPDDKPVSEKEKMLWFDAEANFDRFRTQQGITEMLDKTVEAGFNKIVVDVKPVEGDVLYESSFMTQATQIGDVSVPNRGWDYLQFFLDEAHKRGLKVTVSTTIFPMGMPNRRQGPVYRDAKKWEGMTCLQNKPRSGGGSQMVDIKDDPTKVAAFLNPVLPEVREFALKFIREIVTNYDFDAYALDYCRFPDNQSDFSEASKSAFENYIKASVGTWPDDVFTYDASGNIVPGVYYKQWWEFRSMIIRDFVAEVRREIKAIKSDVKLEYWAASWWGALYANGQNWASNSYMPLEDVESSYYYIWCSNNYYRTGFAEELDTFLLGAYLERIYGADDNESVEYAINRAERMLRNACTMYGTIQCADPNFDIEEACYYCLKRTAGLMVFDIVHVINNNKWSAIKRGIDRALAEDRANE